MKVLIAVDRSAVSDSIIALAVQLLAGRGARALLMNVAPRESDLFGQQLKRKIITDPVPEELRDRRELLDRHAKTLTGSGIDCESLLIRGDPGRTIVREAERWGAELILMGTHGRGGLYRELMGSVSEAVLRARRLPVLIVPSRPANE